MYRNLDEPLESWIAIPVGKYWLRK